MPSLRCTKATGSQGGAALAYTRAHAPPSEVRAGVTASGPRGPAARPPALLGRRRDGQACRPGGPVGDTVGLTVPPTWPLPPFRDTQMSPLCGQRLCLCVGRHRHFPSPQPRGPGAGAPLRPAPGAGRLAGSPRQGRSPSAPSEALMAWFADGAVCANKTLFQLQREGVLVFVLLNLRQSVLFPRSRWLPRHLVLSR